MSKAIYKKGKPIKSIAEFEECPDMCFWVMAGIGNWHKVYHRGWMESWQYRMLKDHIDSNLVFRAERIKVD